MKIALFTGTRAEFGLLRPLIVALKSNPVFDLKLIVSGTHLSPHFGFTADEIISSGIEIDEKTEILISSDSRIGVAKSIGLGLISYSEILERVSPDIVIGLGDRFELFAFVSSAFVLGIPIAHIHGGELTEGAYDDGFRHAITKMSNLHFTSTEKYRQRVIQLGEQPNLVFNVGAIGLDNIRSMDLLDIKSLSKELHIDLTDNYIVVTYHPETNSNESSKESMIRLLTALDSFPEFQIIFTMANADHGGSEINSLITEYSKINADRVFVFSSLGSLKYLSLIKHASIMVGNSSSGIIEMPFFKKPTVNIGNRQKGRVVSNSVINVKDISSDIIEGIKKGLEKSFKSVCEETPDYYGNGTTAHQIVQHLMDFKVSSSKKFYDIPYQKAYL